MGLKPTPLTQVGCRLLTNGYVLSAYAVLLARVHASSFVLEHLFGLFLHDYTVDCNERELFEYANRPPDAYYLEKPDIHSRKSLKRTSTKRTAPSIMDSNQKLLHF